MSSEENKLDNPVWHSLHETHMPFAIDYGDVKFYHPDYCPFGGFVNPDKILVDIDQYSLWCDNFYVVGEKPLYSNKLSLKKELVCLQMLMDSPIRLEISESIITLQPRHENDLFELVNLVQPGYFMRKTSGLGKYFGIFKNEKLVAVTGERMKTNAFTEVSAVVTHPEHTGKGYAKQLVAHTVNKIFDENKIPCLHVAASNTIAINLYEKTGFRKRRLISFWNLIRNDA